jgi:hypothetical protein
MLTPIIPAIVTIGFLLVGGKRDLYAIALVPWLFSFSNFWGIDRVAFLNNYIARV